MEPSILVLHCRPVAEDHGDSPKSSFVYDPK